VDRREWLHRYLVRWLQRRPSITAIELVRLAAPATYREVFQLYRADPEKAADTAINCTPLRGLAAPYASEAH
jgi:hypothetical protein